MLKEISNLERFSNIIIENNKTNNTLEITKNRHGISKAYIIPENISLLTLEEIKRLGGDVYAAKVVIFP